MRNIPLFTTESGVASLTLDQIAFNKTAYIRLQSSNDFEALLYECVNFCKAVGAEKIYVSGKEIPGKCVACGSVIRMSRPRLGIPRGAASLVSVSAERLEQFRQLFNHGMCHVPNASCMTTKMAEQLLADQSGYFVVLGDDLIGIGIAKGEWIHGIVSLKRGMGETIMQALNAALQGEFVRVELIDSNYPAKSLYERMGFCLVETVSQWYEIF